MKKFAIFFPQYHQVEVNNAAWGQGFTDWALVATANAFGYWSKRSPKIGFYDLGNEQVINNQLFSAAQAGLDGFAIYHYWFQDGPELNSIERYLENAKIPDNFYYFYIWANESWTKRWAGKSTEILKTISTEPSNEEIRQHVSYLNPHMQSSAYTRISGRPLFVIYRPEFFKNPENVLTSYRKEFACIGLDPLIGYCLKSKADSKYSELFDFCYLFEPRLFFSFNNFSQYNFLQNLYKKLIHLISYNKIEKWSEIIKNYRGQKAQTYAFSKFLKYLDSKEREKLIDALKCPTQNILTCGWNNAPRYRKNFTSLTVPDKNEFLSMLQSACQNEKFSNELPLLCNAWNEWSEGAAIEPCHYLGDSLLKTYLTQSDLDKRTD